MNVLSAAWFISNRTSTAGVPAYPRSAWKEETDEGGILLDLGTHLVDQALVLFGQPAAVGAEVLRERDGEGSNDAFTIRLHYFTGFSVTLGANCLSSLARPRFHLRGTRGNFWKWGLDPQEDALGNVTKITDTNWGQEPSDHWGTLSVDVDGGMVTRPVPSAPGDYRLFYAGVRDVLLGNPPPRPSRRRKPGEWRGCLSGQNKARRRIATSNATGAANRPDQRTGLFLRDLSSPPAAPRIGRCIHAPDCFPR